MASAASAFEEIVFGLEDVLEVSEFVPELLEFGSDFGVLVLGRPVFILWFVLCLFEAKNKHFGGVFGQVGVGLFFKFAEDYPNADDNRDHYQKQTKGKGHLN